MGLIHVCFDISYDIPEAYTTEKNDTVYLHSYKKLAAFLYSNAHFPVSFFFPGMFLEWIEKKHSEFLSILVDLINRKQIEIIGGGYYEPILPLILPIDRVGQIEQLTTAVRKYTGKRPRGIKLLHNVWDLSLLSSFKTCGMEYLLADSRLLKQTNSASRSIFSPFIVEDMGKTMIVLPVSKENHPSEFKNGADYVQFLDTLTKKTDASIICVSITPKQISDMIDSRWFESFFTQLQECPDVAVSTPSRFLKSYSQFSRVSISTNCLPEISQWSYEPYISRVKNGNESSGIKNFLYTYPEANLLYARMIYVSSLVSQCRGDKSRKKTARETLWKAQNCSAYWFLGDGGVSDRKTRQNAYKYLLHAEKLVRDTIGFAENSSTFDFDFDGLREYVFKFLDYNAFVSLAGGSIFELDVLQNSRNYCDNIRRIPSLDSSRDMYHRRIFIDHLIDKSKMNDFINDHSCIPPLFAGNTYTEVSFDRSRREIKLKTSCLYGTKRQKITLLKNYSFTSNGIQIQFILKNESELPLSAFFAEESNISLEDSSSEAQVIEVITNDSREQPCTSQQFIRHHNVSHVQITDKTSDITFNFQPNENAGLCIQPLSVERPYDSVLKNQYQAQTCTFFWEIEIPPNYEIEKSLYFSLKTQGSVSFPKRKKKSAVQA